MFDEVFFLVSQITGVFLDFSREEMQFADFAMVLNTTKREFLNCNKTLSTP